MTMGRTIVSSPPAIALCFLCIGLLYPISANTELQILPLTGKASVGGEANVTCIVTPEAAITWLFNGEPLKENQRINLTSSLATYKRDADGNEIKSLTSTLHIYNSTYLDDGNYTCLASLDDRNDSKVYHLNGSFAARVLEVTKGPIEIDVADKKNITMKCVFETYKPANVTWYINGSESFITEPYKQLSARKIASEHFIRVADVSVNGVHVCEIEDYVTNTKVYGYIQVKVYAPPKLAIDTVIAINTTELYIKWTVETYNSKVISYLLLTRATLPNGDEEPNFTMYTTDKIGLQNTSHVVKGLRKSTKYQLKLEVSTAKGSHSDIFKEKVETLAEDPIFIPNISIKGFSATSVTIGWPAPPEKIENLIHYYILEARKKDENVPRRAYHSRDGRNLPYMFDNLEPHSTYIFQVCACSDYSKRCGRWSLEMEAATLDGVPGAPSAVALDCGVSHGTLAWAPPRHPNAEIKGYSMELTGNATFKDRFGKEKVVTWGPLSKFTTNDTKVLRFDELQANTLYTVRVSAMTRTRRRGLEQTASCRTRAAPPDHPPRPRWTKIVQNDTYMFKMYLPRVSERNGPLCCYKVYMVRLLPNIDYKKLPVPKEMPVLEHKDAHAPIPALGAYVTDIFSNDNFPPDSVLIMGDGRMHFDPNEEKFKRPECSRCLKRDRLIKVVPITSTTSTVPTTTAEEEDFTEDPGAEETDERRRREINGEPDLDPLDPVKTSEDDDLIKVYDGPLDSSANYTLYVELISEAAGEASLYSEYVNFLKPAPTPAAPQPASAVEIALQITCGVAATVLLLMIVFCIRQTRRSRKLPPHAHLEDNVPMALRWMPCLPRGGARPAPPDMDPIPAEELAKAYAERQADSDYGFQKEFEMLPECFTDRTTHASDARENQPKNRYPDIKAYDQTRVKLSQIDSITGSDYINANYVMGYQDRKQFICAQGPTDTTVNDFWRMIWEQGVELVVMLTNLEEYSKVKCSKYWPDDVRGSRNFGAITVHHVGEKRYSDYIVRELRINKQPTNADGQPIVENNGVAKRNGDCKEASEGSAPTSPREGAGAGAAGRAVRQYHFLMWKDFAAPEHAYSILKFIKRVNEAWSGSVGACCVHCSAGVGRTGTLVALDVLLAQLARTRHVAVFNTVAELRTQRNFLVQSLKQYVFVYRALVEFAHYGDTEIPAGRLKAAVDRLRNTPPGAAACLMETEFQKILNSPIPELIKSCGAGAGEELRAKNRSADVLPYDRNRVILAPVPGRDYSTYINASFIEAYDNSEGFIITQDPLPATVVDFWRMVAEHNVNTIVMLSELGEGKCPRYWDDGTAQYDHISVQYEESESCPYYTRRQFRLTNNKSGWCGVVRQLQYQGWPTAAGHVPEVTRGLAELADAAHHGPMLVHCQLGTERSALFVALCILICQLRAERRVDVCCVARKVRSQRARTIDTFLQYEFLHRAILNYAELHNLLEDS